MEEFKDSGGEFRLVDPKLIVIDTRYQRPDKPNLQAAIAQDPDWRAFGVVSLFDRKGVLICYDGQQRYKGVMKSAKPPTRVPALVFPAPPLDGEARSFLKLNVQRVAPRSYEKHEAAVTAKDEAALAIERAAATAGYTIGPGSGTKADDPNTITAVQALYWIYNRLAEEGTLQVLLQCRDAWTKETDGTNSSVMKGVAQVLIDLDVAYDRPKVTKALSRATPSEILRRATGMMFDMGGSKHVNIRRAIAELCKI